MKSTKKLKVVNLYGPPSSGKTTLAAIVFARMKQAGMSVSLVTEFAREMIYEGRTRMLVEQPIVLGEQFRRLKIIEGHSEWAVTDSPIRLSMIYGEKYHNPEWMYNLSLMDNQFENYGFLLNTIYESEDYGRIHTAKESIKILDKLSEICYDATVIPDADLDIQCGWVLSKIGEQHEFTRKAAVHPTAE